MSVSDIRSSANTSRRCPKTGLALVSAARREVFRLAKPIYGPLDPITRGVSAFEDREEWNRFDVEGQRTVYAASTMEGAYGELLAPLRPKLPTAASAYFDDVHQDDELESLIREEWRSSGYRPPGEVDLTWLAELKLYRITLPARGWLIDIEAAASLSVISTAYAPRALIERGITDITVAELRGPARWLTTAIASRIWPVTLYDGTLSHGVMYGSRYGSEWSCWAVWLRRSKRSHPKGLVTTADSGTEVLQPALNPPLQAVLSTYGLTGAW
ncbi:hypothetical protein [Nocardia jiangxiensis]|uniref:RES domain-containing protein n=1 Tax=Nocardia jiangxiensis TaxID=282685 RepID=A0ABW6SCR2_9NOCA|nr:hypothetical protein [Nocardia jiangxiensis]